MQRIAFAYIDEVRQACEEAELRVALGDAAPLFRDALETRAQRSKGLRRVLRFMREALPNVPAKQRALAADVVVTSISAIGKDLSEQGRSRSAVNWVAAATGEMLCAYLEHLKASVCFETGTSRSDHRSSIKSLVKESRLTHAVREFITPQCTC